MDPRVAREMVLARLGDVGRLKRTCVDLGRKRDREMRLTQWLDEFKSRREVCDSAAEGLAGLHAGRGVDAGARASEPTARCSLWPTRRLLRPLPFRDPDRLVIVDEWGPQQAARSRIELLNFREWATAEPDVRVDGGDLDSRALAAARR